MMRYAIAGSAHKTVLKNSMNSFLTSVRITSKSYSTTLQLLKLYNHQVRENDRSVSDIFFAQRTLKPLQYSEKYVVPGQL